jgi:oxygen-dependent protoporphyrinogen oxidase
MSVTGAPKSIAVLGAGITGLTAAHRLAQRGHRVRVFESAARTGGAIRSERRDGWLVEAGPNTMLAGDPAIAALIDELGLGGECLSASPAAKNRYILRQGRVLPVPLSPPALLGSPLLSLGAKLRLLREFFASRRVRTIDLSLADFIASHFGEEIVDYALNPFVTGVYAGDPRKLSARHAFPRLWASEQAHGSLLRGQIAEAKARKARGGGAAGIVSFRTGLQALPNALAARLPAGCLVTGARIEALVPGPSWSIVWHDGTQAQTETCDAVVAALPAPALAQLRFGTLGERPLASLDTIEHPPVSSLFLGYRREQVAHPLDGFGLLVPAVESRSLLGVLFSSTLFPGRAPEGHVALTVLVGGTRQPEIARLPPEKILGQIERDLRELLGVNGTPVLRQHAFWPRAIPQYNLGYERHLETMAAAERSYPRLFIGGQARDGIALPACILSGERLAERSGG